MNGAHHPELCAVYIHLWSDASYSILFRHSQSLATELVNTLPFGTLRCYRLPTTFMTVVILLWKKHISSLILPS